MKWDIRTPCASCPYRRDTRLGLWSKEEFIDLLRADRVEGLKAPLYACHGSAKQPEPTVCAGWLLDQRRRGVPKNIGLRLALLTDTEAAACFEEVECLAPTYDSIEEMALANFKAMLREDEE